MVSVPVTFANLPTGLNPLELFDQNFAVLVAAINSGVAPYVADRTALAALDTTKDTVAYLKEAGRQGWFQWNTSNLSARVSVDTQQGLYVAPASVPSGASGAWVRIFPDDWNVEWWGALHDGSTSDTVAVQGALNTLVAGAALFFPAGTYLVKDLIVPDKLGVRLYGPAPSNSANPTAGLGAILKALATSTWVMASEKYTLSNVFANGPQTFDSLCFDANGLANYGLVLVGYENRVERCVCVNAVLDGLLVTTIHSDGTQGNSVVENRIFGNQFSTNGRHGCNIQTSSVGGPTDWWYGNNTSAANGVDGLHSDSTAGASIGPSNHHYSNTGYDINLTVVSMAQIFDNIFEATGTASFTVLGAPVTLKLGVNLSGFTSGATCSLSGNTILGMVNNQCTNGTVINSAGNSFTSFGTDKAGWYLANSTGNITATTGDFYNESTPFKVASGTDACIVYAMNSYSAVSGFAFSGKITSVAGVFTRSQLGTAAIQNTGTSGANVPLMNAVNTWSALQIVSGSSSFFEAFRAQSTNTDANVGPAMVFNRYPSSGGGSANDNLGIFQFNGHDAGSNIATYGEFFAQIIDPTNGSEDGRLIFRVMTAGSAVVEMLYLGPMVEVRSSFSRRVPVTKTADFTVAATENWLINNKSGSSCTVTLPSAASYPGREIMIKTIQAQTTISASSNVIPLDGGAAGTAILSANAGRWATLVSNGTNWEIMAGVV